MEENEIKIGDVVMLKSSSIKMTVKNFIWEPTKGEYSKNLVLCTWLDSNQNFKEAEFSTSQLIKL